jgi:gp16 family phage-associated protein
MSNVTPEIKAAVMEKLSKQGLSMRGWAIRNGFSPTLVRQVIRGECPARFNKGHKIAVLLGIKEGEILES